MLIGTSLPDLRGESRAMFLESKSLYSIFDIAIDVRILKIRYTWRLRRPQCTNGIEHCTDLDFCREVPDVFREIEFAPEGSIQCVVILLTFVCFPYVVPCVAEVIMHHDSNVVQKTSHSSGSAGATREANEINLISLSLIMRTFLADPFVCF